MPYDSESGLYERRSTTVIDASPDGDTVYIAIDAKLDQAADDTVTDLNHHKTNGNHYPATSVADDSRFLRQSPSGTVSWANGVVAADAALKDMSNVASGAIAPAKVAQDASNRFFTDTERTKLEGIQALAQVNADITKSEIEAKLTGSISTHTHADASTTAKGLIEIATDAEVQAGTSTSLAVTPAGLKAGQIALGTSATASGTAIDFTGIPSWAKRVTVMFDGVSTNGTSPPLIQLGHSGGIESSGYLGTAGNHGSGTPAVASYTTGFAFMGGAWAASIVVQGFVTLNKNYSNIWAYSGNLGRSDAVGFLYGGGNKSLSNILDRIRITTVNGTDQFDAGSINISWE
jgi:hypothetical protein